MTIKPAHGSYLVLNPLLSVRKSLNTFSPDYEVFINWPAGSIMGPSGLDYPDHAAIAEFLAFGHIKAID